MIAPCLSAMGGASRAGRSSVSELGVGLGSAVAAAAQRLARHSATRECIRAAGAALPGPAWAMRAGRINDAYMGKHVRHLRLQHCAGTQHMNFCWPACCCRARCCRGLLSLGGCGLRLRWQNAFICASAGAAHAGPVQAAGAVYTVHDLEARTCSEHSIKAACLQQRSAAINSLRYRRVLSLWQPDTRRTRNLHAHVVRKYGWWDFRSLQALGGRGRASRIGHPLAHRVWRLRGMRTGARSRTAGLEVGVRRHQVTRLVAGPRGGPCCCQAWPARAPRPQRAASL